MRMVPVARATRCVSALAETSTMWAWPWASKWVSGVVMTQQHGGNGRCHDCDGSSPALEHVRDPHPPSNVASRQRGPCPDVRGRAGPAPAGPLAQTVSLDSPNVRLPALGESAAEDFGVGAERRLGEQIMGEIRRDPDYLDDPVLLEYLQSLWLPLVAAARQRGDVDVDTGNQFAWESFLVRDRSVNAFALPGGYVGVHLGLIAMTATRDELASVLAHELTHVTQRHIARGMANQAAHRRCWASPA
jgi:hypothetical protein